MSWLFGSIVNVILFVLGRGGRGISAVELVDDRPPGARVSGPWWRVTAGNQKRFVYAYGIRARGQGGKQSDCRLRTDGPRGQRPRAKKMPRDTGVIQDAVISLEATQTLYFGPYEPVLDALNREKVDFNGAVIPAQPFVLVQGSKKPQYGRWVYLNWSTGEVNDRLA